MALQNPRQLLSLQSWRRWIVILGLLDLLGVQVQPAHNRRVDQTVGQASASEVARGYMISEIGYPLSYSFSISNRFVEKDSEAYFSFKVNGPKSSVNIEMTAGAAKAG